MKNNEKAEPKKLRFFIVNQNKIPIFAMPNQTIVIYPVASGRRSIRNWALFMSIDLLHICCMQIHIRNLRLSFPFLGPSGTRIVWFGDFNGKMTAVRVFENLSLMPNQTIRI